MPVLPAVAAPWDFPLGVGQHELVMYSMTVAGLALFAHFVRTWVSLDEVGPRYRGALYASLCVSGVAFLSYVYLVLEFDAAYVLEGDVFVPGEDARNTYLPRYMDWSVTVPLLMVELLAVSALAGARATRMRLVLVAAAFLMIFTGFLGAGVIGGGRSTESLLFWGIVSTAFYAVLYVLVIQVLRASRGGMGAEAYGSFRGAVILLLSVWGVYPLAYALHTWVPGAASTTTIQVAFSFADVVAKIGFAAFIHKVAKLRTAEDVTAGEDTHPESVWVSSVKHSDGVQPHLQAPSPH